VEIESGGLLVTIKQAWRRYNGRGSRTTWSEIFKGRVAQA
jgi:hypothetical protein